MKTQLINIQHKEERIFVVPKQYVFNYEVVEQKFQSVVVFGNNVDLNYNLVNNQFISLKDLPVVQEEGIKEEEIQRDIELIDSIYDELNGITVSIMTTNQDVILVEPTIDELVERDIETMRNKYNEIHGIFVNEFVSTEKVIILPPKEEEVMCCLIYTQIVSSIILTLIINKMNMIVLTIERIFNQLIPETFSEAFIMFAVLIVIVCKQWVKQT